MTKRSVVEVRLQFIVNADGLTPEELEKLKKTLHRAVIREADKVYARQDPQGVGRAKYYVNTDATQDKERVGTHLTTKDYL